MNIKLPAVLTQGLITAGFTFLGALTFNIAANQSVGAPAQRSDPDATRSLSKQLCRGLHGGEFSDRTDLFFGLSKPDGGTVGDAAFQNFVDREVTPRFPDGLTLLTGTGQYKNTQGTLVKEGARLLILLYPAGKSDSSRKIEQIRQAYQTTFSQESVLRIDSQSCVSF